jgi:hypothetical protein
MLSEKALWDLVDKWQGAARDITEANMPYLSTDPTTAWGQAMNEAAEDLVNYLMDHDAE